MQSANLAFQLVSFYKDNLPWENFYNSHPIHKIAIFTYLAPSSEE